MNKTKRILALIFALQVWFSVIGQYVLSISNTELSIGEQSIRFFSYFTLLTNGLLGLFFTNQAFFVSGKRISLMEKSGFQTALVVYISIVGLVYHLALRQLWNPEGFQMIVDQLLHTFNPIVLILFWFLFEKKEAVKWSYIPKWLIYPLVYLIAILIRGCFSGFYPYPFVNVEKIGIWQVLLNSLFLTLGFVFFSAFYVLIAKRIQRFRKMKPKDMND